MKLQTVDNHSFCPDLLTGGPVLDAGCRGFRFADAFAQRGHDVLALDPSRDVEYKGVFPAKVVYKRVALVGSWVAKTGFKQICLEMGSDPEAYYVKIDGTFGFCDYVDYTTITDLSKDMGCDWDLVKLNIEGPETDILLEWPSPIARQVVVAFHLHTGRQTEEEIEGALKHMSQWYEVFNHVKERRYGCHPSYWDTVLVRKDLV